MFGKEEKTERIKYKRVVKGLTLLGMVSGADGADNGPVIKASQEKRTRH